jgi:hypothetical protein
MYFIKYQPIKKQLQERSLTDREGLPYYIILMASTAIASALPADSTMNHNNDFIFAILNVTTITVGIIYCYSKNGGKSGLDFIQKSVVLGFIVFVRCVLPFIVILCLIFFFKGILEAILGITVGTESLAMIIFNILVDVFYFWRLGKHMQDTRVSFSEQSDAREEILP